MQFQQSKYFILMQNVRMNRQKSPYKTPKSVKKFAKLRSCQDRLTVIPITEKTAKRRKPDVGAKSPRLFYLQCRNHS